MRTIALMLVGSLGGAALGLPYIYHAFGPTEAEVVSWGQVSLYTGIYLAIVSLALGHQRARPFKLLLALGYFSLALSQLPPIYAWFAFHGRGISDGTPPSPFVAHWVYAIPHIIVLAIGSFILYSLLGDLLPGSQSRE
jgi:hypothetical protein